MVLLRTPSVRLRRCGKVGFGAAVAVVVAGVVVVAARGAAGVTVPLLASQSSS